MTTKSALITGATGFVGSHLAARLAESKWILHLIVRPQSELRSIAGLEGRAQLHFYDGSIKTMQRIFDRAKPDVVFHLASFFVAEHTAEDIEPLFRSNLLFGTQMVEAMIQTGIYRLINAGTSWQHYHDADYNPVCLYAATKQAFEDILAFYIDSTPLRVITLKLYDTYGPGDFRPKLFAALHKALLENQTLSMSLGEQLIDLVFIDDVVDAFILAAERIVNLPTTKVESFAVSGGIPASLRNLVDLYAKLIGRVIPVSWGGRSYRHREVMVPWHGGPRLPGWTPKVSLEEGFRRMNILSLQGRS